MVCFYLTRWLGLHVETVCSANRSWSRYLNIIQWLLGRNFSRVFFSLRNTNKVATEWWWDHVCFEKFKPTVDNKGHQMRIII